MSFDSFVIVLFVCCDSVSKTDLGNLKSIRNRSGPYIAFALYSPKKNRSCWKLQIACLIASYAYNIEARKSAHFMQRIALQCNTTKRANFFSLRGAGFMVTFVLKRAKKRRYYFRIGETPCGATSSLS